MAKKEIQQKEKEVEAKEELFFVPSENKMLTKKEINLLNQKENE